QSRRLAVSAWITPPPSSSQPASPEMSASSGAWTTTAARSGSGSPANEVEARATSASARLASAWQAPSSPGITGSCSAKRSIARAKTAPSAAGSSASSPNRLPSSKCHHDRNRLACASRTSSMACRTATSAFRRIQATETPLAHETRFDSVSAVASRLISTTLSIPSWPEGNAPEMRGSPSRAWAAWIQRDAFQQEMPYRMERKCAVSGAPDSRQASSRSASAMSSNKFRCAPEMWACSASIQWTTSSFVRSGSIHLHGIEHAFGCLLGGSQLDPISLESFGLPIAEGDPGPGRLPYGEWLPRSFVQPDRTIVGDRHDVFDPRPEPAREVDAGLDRERHAGLELRRVAGHDVRRLVDLKADPVAGAVDEPLAVARVVHHVARGPVAVLGGS